MPSPKYRTEVDPRFSDFDLQGILNSRQYLDLIGEARVDQMRRCYHTPMEDYTARGQTFVLRSLAIEYEKPIYYGSKFSIETWIEEIKGPMAKVCFRFISPTDEVLYASGSGIYFLVDLNTKKPARFPENAVKAYLGIKESI